MTYYVKMSKAVHRQLDNLPGYVQGLARKRVLQLASDPRPDDAKELEGHSDYYRIWVMGRFRVVWQVLDEDQIVDVLYVGPKLPDLYEKLGLERPLS